VITRSRRGFTLLEVMIGLALLGFGLAVLIKSASGSIVNTRTTQLMGVSTDLARGKIYELEEQLLKDGFSDTEQMQENQNFEEEGWESIRYSYKIEEVKLPSWEALQEMAKRKAEGSGSAGSGSGEGEEQLGGFENSALGGMMAQLGGMGGGSGDIDSSMGAAFIQGQYQMVQEVLKVSIRKVTLIVTYDILPVSEELSVEDRCPWDLTKKSKVQSDKIVCVRTVAFFTDAGAMDKVLSGLGSQDLDDAPAAGSSAPAPTPAPSGKDPSPRPPGVRR
jgi:prepilin-type N-terminal cleavage/methylation domain-containing protein